MKQQLFKSLLIIATITLAFTLSSFITNETINKEDGEGYLMVRVYESAAKSPESKIVIIKEDGSVVNILLEMFAANTLEKNFKTIHTELSKLKNEGYTLVSTSGGPNSFGIITTYIFQK